VSAPGPDSPEYYEYDAELQRARVWARDFGLHMTVLLCALSTTEACLASCGRSLDSEFEHGNRLRAELDRYRAVAQAARALHAVIGPDDDPEWSALGDALAALDTKKEST